MSRIGVIAAMPQECEFFRQQLLDTTNSQYLNTHITHGTWAEQEVCLIESGIGKVNATIAAEWLLREFKPDLIINTGSAGGIKSGVKIGDFVFADRVCHHDLDLTPIGLKFGQLPHLPDYFSIKDSWLTLLRQAITKQQGLKQADYHIGTIASGDSFIYQDQQVGQIQSRFDDVVACEMEAGAVTQVCHLHGVDCLIIRNLSDVAGEEGPENFHQFLVQAGKKSAELVFTLIETINQD